MDSPFTETYFMDGKRHGVSLYENYHWIPELTVPMVQSMIDHLGIDHDDTVLDFGCARGYTVKAFIEAFGIEAYGVDVSEWAIANADEETRPYLWLMKETSAEFWQGLDYIIAKDVLEHVGPVTDVVTGLMDSAKVAVFAVVPLSMFDGSPYVVPDYEKDVTHLHRFSLATWARMFMRPGWTVEASYAVKGIKENYASYQTGNGFITARRL